MSKIACIGAGVVGRAWAVVFARAGHQVTLFDAGDGVVENTALPAIAKTLSQLKDAGQLKEDPAVVLEQIAPALSLEEAVDGVEYVQESVREDLDTKRALFTELAEAASLSCVFASSTSALPGSQFFEGIRHPERALVAHPVNPPSLIPLVELCPTPDTSQEVLDSTRVFLEGAGMAPITVQKEIDGFILNRLQYTLVAEAMHLVGEGYCSAADIDRVITQGLALRWANIGPFEVAHLNATEGFKDFVAKLEGMMRAVGQDAKPDYPWDHELVERIHAEMASQVPVDGIPERQEWRDGTILATRALQTRLKEDG